MIVRAFKHILRAVISAVDKEKMASSIAGALNLLLGVPENRELDKSREVHPLVWKWLELFLKKRFDWDPNKLNYKDVRKFAILRGLCHKVMESCICIFSNSYFLGIYLTKFYELGFLLEYFHCSHPWKYGFQFNLLCEVEVGSSSYMVLENFTYSYAT